MTDEQIQARVASTPAQADGRPVACLVCGQPLHPMSHYTCGEPCSELQRWFRIADAWDARKATPAPVRPAPAPAVGQVWRRPDGSEYTLTKRHEGGRHWRYGDGVFDFIHCDNFNDSKFIAYVRGPAPVTVDPVPVGSRWAGRNGQTPFTVTRVEGAVRYFTRDNGIDSCLTNVPCAHGCGAMTSYPTRHLLRNGRDWSCVELPVAAAVVAVCQSSMEGYPLAEMKRRLLISAATLAADDAVVAEMRAYRERRGGGR